MKIRSMIAKNGLLIIWTSLLLLVACTDKKENSQGETFLNQVDQVKASIGDDSKMLVFFDQPQAGIKPAFTSLPQGSTKPKGWIHEMMVNDLKRGMVGALDELYPGIKKDDLYRTARRAGLEDVPEMGDLVLTGEAWEQSIMWWNAETAGNWWDGFVRHAFIIGDETSRKQAQAIVDNLIESQDKDGYIGIYQPNLRYQHKGSNGELWAQTTAFRTLLAYYEITGDARALRAVEKAMKLTMKEYGPEGRHPFLLENAFGGVTHGLMITDVCEVLHRITGEPAYQDYATWLYKAFSTYNINRAFNDLRYPFLLHKDSLFTGHGVHTYEHIRTLVNAYYHTGYAELGTAYEHAVFKLNQVILPSGAGHGNEWLLGMPADPNTTSTEYCCMLELRNSLSSIFQKTGDIRFADQAEKLTYNAMLGSRNEDGTAMVYGKGDNCFVLDGQHHGADGSHADPRFKYSPTHSDPAVCCAPNYARNLPYFLDQMWLKAEDGFVAAMYGPSILETEVNGVKVSIHQNSDYPFHDVLRFDVFVEEPVEFALYFRKPHDLKNMFINIKGGWEDVKKDGGTYTQEGDFSVVRKKWYNGEPLGIILRHEMKEKSLPNGEVYVQRGPIVYALPIPHENKTIKEYGLKGFKDYYSLPQNELHRSLQIPRDADFVFNGEKGHKLEGKFWNAERESIQTVELVPMGKTVLRRVSFPMKEGL